ncbi:MAG TPA: YcaO-like family protein [Polyangiaceae bacterium]|nr:YcaO-like family protein [Polyangiaceae bacterium]
MSHPDPAADELERLFREFPCSPHWGKPEVFADVVDIGGVRFYLDGLLASAGAEKTATGSAASVTGHQLDRAYFELVERTCLLDAIDASVPERAVLDAAGKQLGSCDQARAFPVSPAESAWAYARSNGVAAGPDWAAACAAAEAEARERHHVLSAWYGFAVPVPHPLDDLTLHALSPLYDFEAYSFPAPQNDRPSPSFSVIGCFGFPKATGAPFVAGFGAALDVSNAERRAVGETLQRLGFLWGEAIPDSEPPLARTADYHQELYLWPPMQRRVRAWLAGEHAGCCGAFPPQIASHPGFIDITPVHLAPRLRVAKMITGLGLPLTFGLGHPQVERAAALGAHPIA